MSSDSQSKGFPTASKPFETRLQAFTKALDYTAEHCRDAGLESTWDMQDKLDVATALAIRINSFVKGEWEGLSREEAFDKICSSDEIDDLMENIHIKRMPNAK